MAKTRSFSELRDKLPAESRARTMGGELEIRAVFPEGSVRLKRFGEAANSSHPA
jgi:hypothetical protein